MKVVNVAGDDDDGSEYGMEQGQRRTDKMYIEPEGRVSCCTHLDRLIVGYLFPLFNAVTILLIAIVVQFQVTLDTKNQTEGLVVGLISGFMAWMVFGLALGSLWTHGRRPIKVIASLLTFLVFGIMTAVFVAILTCQTTPDKICDLHELVAKIQ